MKNFLHKFFKPKVNWKFQKADFVETTEELNNPARGWYSIFPFFVEEEPDFDKISWCADSTDTLALVIINIGAYRERLLDIQAMKNIRSILSYFKRYSYDIILRIAYDHEGKAVEREPFFFKQVVEHMEQLTPVIKEFSDVVFVVQGMLFGNWGEMHTSRFVAPDKMKFLWGMMQTEFQGRPYLAVRRPNMWRMLHPESNGRIELTHDTTGLFDDAIFGSDTIWEPLARSQRKMWAGIPCGAGKTNWNLRTGFVKVYQTVERWFAATTIRKPILLQLLRMC